MVGGDLIMNISRRVRYFDHITSTAAAVMEIFSLLFFSKSLYPFWSIYSRRLADVSIKY
jgi:hypothetical protein